MHRTTPTIFPGSLSPPWASKHPNFMIQTTQCYSFVKLCRHICINKIYIYSRLSIYFLISRSLISVKVISRSLFFEKLFSGLTFSHPPLPPPPPPLQCLGYFRCNFHIKPIHFEHLLTRWSICRLKSRFGVSMRPKWRWDWTSSSRM